MGKEIEALDPALREVAARLKAAPAACVGAGFHANVMAAVHAAAMAEHANWPRRIRRPAAFAAAAAIIVLLGATALFIVPAPQQQAASADYPGIALANGTGTTSSIAPYAPSYAVRELVSENAVPTKTISSIAAEIARTQNADGGWGTPALTALNTAALAMAVRVGDRAALCAWKRGVRYLRTHGIPESDPF